jgi:hypothetical protein
MPIEEVQQELREAGIDVEPVHKRLRELIDKHKRGSGPRQRPATPDRIPLLSQGDRLMESIDHAHGRRENLWSFSNRRARPW